MLSVFCVILSEDMAVLAVEDIIIKVLEDVEGKLAFRGFSTLRILCSQYCSSALM